MPMIDKKAMSEEDVKLNYITPSIVSRGWQGHITMETAVKFTDGKANIRGNYVTREKAKKADYVLYLAKNYPIPIVEAKDNNHTVGHGLPPKLTESELLQLTKSSMNVDQIDYEYVSRQPLVQDSLSQTEVDAFLGTMRTFNENLAGILENDPWESFAKNALSPSQRVGVCSLSETRDNKPMWSLYGEGYRGYCIEYEISRCKELILNLSPVIYTKRANNSLIKKMLEYALSAMMRAFSDERISGNIGAAMELFCTKDSDWSYQKERRIIGKAGERCTVMPIKAVYLGFKASARNIGRMKRVAKEKRFSLFLMNPPDGTKRISYKQFA